MVLIRNRGDMPVSKERNLCQQRGKEMVPGSISGAAPDEETSQ